MQLNVLYRYLSGFQLRTWAPVRGIPRKLGHSKTEGGSLEETLIGVGDGEVAVRPHLFIGT